MVASERDVGISVGRLHRAAAKHRLLPRRHAVGCYRYCRHAACLQQKRVEQHLRFTEIRLIKKGKTHIYAYSPKNFSKKRWNRKQ